jgi:hypothetical protein
MGNNYRRVLSGLIDSQEGTRRTYMLKEMVRVHPDALFDERLKRLETKDADR